MAALFHSVLKKGRALRHPQARSAGHFGKLDRVQGQRSYVESRVDVTQSYELIAVAFPSADQLLECVEELYSFQLCS